MRKKYAKQIELYMETIWSSCIWWISQSTIKTTIVQKLETFCLMWYLYAFHNTSCLLLDLVIPSGLDFLSPTIAFTSGNYHTLVLLPCRFPFFISPASFYASFWLFPSETMWKLVNTYLWIGQVLHFLVTQKETNLVFCRKSRFKLHSKLLEVC